MLSPTRAGLHILSKLAPPTPSPIYDVYWRFATERQSIFYSRLSGLPPPYTSDPILANYRFTNAYRASDRVSQYLIRNVIYSSRCSPDDLLFRILLFKVFNRIDTWELLQSQTNHVSLDRFSVEQYGSILAEAMRHGRRVYSAAYIMPSESRAKVKRPKHAFHLELIAEMVKGGLAARLSDCHTMSDAYRLLLSYRSIGPFLAYQYVTDINYSELTDFSESEFVEPGPGCVRGVRKCFTSLGGFTIADTVRYVMDRQEQEFADRGLEFKNLFGRRLQLIDCQNLFCEVDKYCRVAHPEFSGGDTRKRIKQRFSPNHERLPLMYPPKWQIAVPDAFR